MATLFREFGHSPRQKWLLAAARFEQALMRHYEALKFDQNQPRVPAGQSGGGQWTSGEASAAKRSSGLATECWSQYRRDIFQCKMRPPILLRASDGSARCVRTRRPHSSAQRLKAPDM